LGGLGAAGVLVFGAQPADQALGLLAGAARPVCLASRTKAPRR
jgi:hypothetical protein